MRIVKPLNLGLLYRIIQEEQQHLFVGTVIAFFSFDSQLTLESEVDLWKFTAEELGPESALDSGMPKPHGEVVVSGSFFAPDGNAVPAGVVRLQLGSIDKSLNVFGERSWQKQHDGRLLLSDPQPITSLAISYENAFGGEDFAKNPLGKGHIPSLAEYSGATCPFPNILAPRYPINSPEQDVDPAGFGPLDLTWPQRYNKIGTYGEKWLNERFPGFAEDLDPSFFNTVAEDQQITGYFEGTESFILENMHPEKPILRSQLPPIRPRCFIDHHNQSGDPFRELPLRLDTIHLFPHAEKGIMIFRGQIPVNDDAASEIKHLLLGYEGIEQTPKSMEHYQQALEKRIDKEKGHQYMLNEADLIPEGSKSALMALLGSEDVDAAEDPLAKNLQARGEREKEKLRKQLEAMGLNPDDYIDTDESPQPVPGISELEEIDILTEKLLDDARKQPEAMMKTFREAAKSLGLDLDQDMEKAKQQSGGRIHFSAEENIELLRKYGFNDPQKEEKLRETEQQFDAMYMQYGHLFPQAPPQDDALKAEMRQTILDGYAQGKSFQGMEFTGVDLSGLDLQGIDLQGAFLEGADFSGTNLSAAKLSGSMLARANLQGAQLTGAEMAAANLGQADLSSADLQGANLEEAVLYQALLTDALFTGCQMASADLSECKGQHAILSGVDLSKAKFIESDLSHADLSDSNLSEALFLNVQAVKTDFSGAQLKAAIFTQLNGDGAIFAKANMANLSAAMDISLRVADFRAAKLVNANLRGADLFGANFEMADISCTDLSECNLEYSIFYRAVAKQSMFMKADLSNANMISINLYEGSLQQATLAHTDLSGSNLFAADLLQTDCSTTLLKEANIQKTILSKWSSS